tara:strand:- start:1200 stop:1946 length:747 start_codon:yes stop_codon:yes gene_type:complete
MKLIFSLSLFLSFMMIADDHVESQMYEPNKAEYYIFKYKEGKDADDLIGWSKEWSKWSQKGEAANAFKNYNVTLLFPYYHGDATSLDGVWVGVSPNSTEHFKGNQYWVENGAKLLKTLPVINHQITETWQRQISETKDGSAGYAVYMDCNLGEGVTNVQHYNAAFEYAKAAQVLGDNIGRKMIWPSTGMKPDWDYDFVYLMYASSISEMGSWEDTFWSEYSDLPEKKALDDLGGQCFNARSYTAMSIK